MSQPIQVSGREPQRVPLYDAKNRLSELLDRVQRGEAFWITRRGQVVARLGDPTDEPDRRPAAVQAIALVRALRVDTLAAAAGAAS